MNSIARVADVSPNTVSKLLLEAGKACEVFHDREVRGVQSRRVQCDEIWSFIHAKQKNVSTAKAAPVEAAPVEAVPVETVPVQPAAAEPVAAVKPVADAVDKATEGEKSAE